MAYTDQQLFEQLSKDLLLTVGENTRGNLSAAAIAHNAQVVYLQARAAQELAVPVNMDVRVADLIWFNSTWLIDAAQQDNSQDMDKYPFNRRIALHNLAVERMLINWP